MVIHQREGKLQKNNDYAAHCVDAERLNRADAHFDDRSPYMPKQFERKVAPRILTRLARPSKHGILDIQRELGLIDSRGKPISHEIDAEFSPAEAYTGAAVLFGLHLRFKKMYTLSRRPLWLGDAAVHRDPKITEAQTRLMKAGSKFFLYLCRNIIEAMIYFYDCLQSEDEDGGPEAAYNMARICATHHQLFDVLFKPIDARHHVKSVWDLALPSSRSGVRDDWVTVSGPGEPPTLFDGWNFLVNGLLPRL